MVVVVPCGGGMPYLWQWWWFMSYTPHTPARRRTAHLPVNTLHTCPSAPHNPYPPHTWSDPYPPYPVRSLPSALGAIPNLCARCNPYPLCARFDLSPPHLVRSLALQTATPHAAGAIPPSATPHAALGASPHAALGAFPWRVHNWSTVYPWPDVYRLRT